MAAIACAPTDPLGERSKGAPATTTAEWLSARRAARPETNGAATAGVTKRPPTPDAAPRAMPLAHTGQGSPAAQRTSQTLERSLRVMNYMWRNRQRLCAKWWLGARNAYERQATLETCAAVQRRKRKTPLPNATVNATGDNGDNGTDVNAVAPTLREHVMQWGWRWVRGGCNTEFAHARDSRLCFDAPTHKYWLDDTKQELVSATTAAHTLFDEFKGDEVVARILAGRAYAEGRSEWSGLTSQQILACWDEASNYGTRVHEACEKYLLQDAASTLDQALQWAAHLPRGLLLFLESEAALQPYRVEWRIYAEQWGLAGTIDAVFLDLEYMKRFSEAELAEVDAGRRRLPLVIVDWKNCGNVGKYGDRRYGKSETTRSMPDAKYYHYTVQLNVYKEILEAHYNVSVTRMVVVNFPTKRNASRCEVFPSSSKTHEIFPIERVDLAPELAVWRARVAAGLPAVAPHPPPAAAEAVVAPTPVQEERGQKRARDATDAVEPDAKRRRVEGAADAVPDAAMVCS